jgi:acyl-CoA synthetase (AMP-forming)/AMP-acid ligase II/lysophospholipase L1-like esterase/acyl carrier protein
MSEVLFISRLRGHGQQPALISDDGRRLSYAQLADAVDAQARILTGPARLVIVEMDNSIECVVAYLACLQAGYPVLLSEPGSTASDPRIGSVYGAAMVFRLVAGAWRFAPLGTALPIDPHPDLSVLLSTSGTTGSPKLVRLSRDNIEANAASIAGYLGLSSTERAITSLPLYYSYGMSVLNSHLHAGAAVLLTRLSVADAPFWTFVGNEGATSLSGVPFTFDLLERIGFRSRHYPTLRYLAQAGGRLPAQRVRLYGEWAQAAGKQLFVMYGQTEASPRMAYVPPAQLLDNVDAIGIPVPGGSFALLGEDGLTVEASDVPGELVYRGPNVMMGYAEAAADLAKGKETFELRTGDLACRKENGCYYIIGRKSRFSKIVGLRISLDEVERWVHGCGLAGIVSGDDRVIVVAITDAGRAGELKQQLVRRFALPASALVVLELDAIPVLPSGKFDYRTVLRLGTEAIDAPQAGPASLLAAYREVLGNTDVRPTDSFLDLGGDSINLVELALVLEAYLGMVPDNWEARSITSLEQLKLEQSAAPDAAASPGAVHPVKRRGGMRQAALVAFALLFAGEATLQARTYIKTGRSAINMMIGESRVMMNERFGAKTYRPNITDPKPDDDLEFTTNTLGFRSPEISFAPQPGELRIAVVGASTVAGAYAKTNSVTFPHLLQERLRQAMPGRLVNVINAGVEGYTIKEIDILVERAIIPLRPDIVVIYPGFNDMANICRASSGKASVARQPLPAPSLPRWVLTRELISKNTLPLREVPVRAARVDVKTHFPASYGETLDRMMSRLEAAGIKPVLLTVARAFKPGEGEIGRRLATTALFYNYCLDYDGLNEAGSLFNQTIAGLAQKHGATLIDLGKMMPSGPKHFVDAAHFTRAGEELSSEIIFHELVNDTKLVKPSGLTASK